MSLAYACIADASGMVCFVSKNPSLDQMARLLLNGIDFETDHVKSFQGHSKTKKSLPSSLLFLSLHLLSPLLLLFLFLFLLLSLVSEGKTDPLESSPATRSNTS